MKVKFPVDGAEKRQALLQAVANIKDILAAHADESETLRTLHPASVAALTDSGLFALKGPAELGGVEAEPITQLEVIEATSYIDPSAGWCLCICNGGASLLGSSLPQAAVDVIYALDRSPRFAGSFTPGNAVAVSGGYRLSGRWPWASGIRHADWVAAMTVVGPDGNSPQHPRIAAFPAAQVEIHDNWHVSGLKGTGSSDFSVTDLFVPEAFTIDMRIWEPKRGGPFYQFGIPGILVNELVGFALGVARRALDSIIEVARTKGRGYGKQTVLADRAVFQRAIGEGDLRLRAARALAIDVLGKAWDTVCAGKKPTPELQIELRSMTTLVTDVALDTVARVFRYGGGSAIHLNCVLQRCLRDMQAEAQHLLVSDITYEMHGQCLLGVAGVDPMG